MKYSDLISISMNNYRKNGFISHVLFFFIMLLACAFLLLGLLLADLIIFLIPFLFIPCFFAVQIAVILLREQEMISFRGFLRCYANYYSEKFMSTFRVIKAILWSLLFTVIFGFVYMMSLNIGLYYTNFMGYQSIMYDITSNIQLSIEEIQRVFYAHREFFEYLMIFNNVPVYFFYSLCFLFFITRNNVSLFYRLDTMELLGQANKIIQERILKKYRKEYYLAYFYTNWPTLLLFIGGFILGGYVGFLTVGTYAGVFVLGLALALFITFGLYGPFYISVNEAIYIFLKDKYKLEFESMKGELNSTLAELLERMNEEENKKDSDES